MTRAEARLALKTLFTVAEIRIALTRFKFPAMDFEAAASPQTRHINMAERSDGLSFVMSVLPNRLRAIT
jgi:hypothetical protein